MDDTKRALTEQSRIVTDMILRVTALERVLLEKGVITEDEYKVHLQAVANEFSDLIKQQAATLIQTDKTKTELPS